MPTEIVTVYPKCEAVIEYRDKEARRWRERVCKLDGARYLIVGDLGTVEQNLCQAHKKTAIKQHPEWRFVELKRAVKKETREIVSQPAGHPVDDSDIPF